MKQETIKKYLVISAAGALLAVVAIIWFFAGGGESLKIFVKPTVVEEVIVLPETKSIVGVEGWYPNKDARKVPLVPQNEGDRVTVSGAVLTPYGAYLAALPNAEHWASDAQLVFIKSLGTVMVDGRALGWQVVFGSRTKKKGYEVLTEREVVVAQKEIPSNVYGAAVPKNFEIRDAVWAIGIVAGNPQFKKATMTGLNFTYNPDAKAWEYLIANTFGGSSVRVR